jgi:hypothetical protein
MEIEKLVAALAGVPADSGDPSIDLDHRGRLWTELADKSETLLKSVAQEAFCTAQEWDNRIDCEVRQPDGSFVAEMIGLEDVDVDRILKAAARLRRRSMGEKIILVNERGRPVYLGGPLPDDR